MLQCQYQDRKSWRVKFFQVKLKVSEYSRFAFAIFWPLCGLLRTCYFIELCVSVCSVVQLYPILCYPMDCSRPGFSVHGIFQTRGLEWVPLPSPFNSVQFSSVAQSCPTLRDPVDFSPPGSSVHGIFQTRGLEWAAIAFSGSLL